MEAGTPAVEVIGQAAATTVVLALAEGPAFLPHGVDGVDCIGCGNGVVGEMGAGSVPLRGSEAISPSMFCHCDAAQLRMLMQAEARH
jgi:hypothetical protein